MNKKEIENNEGFFLYSIFCSRELKVLWILEMLYIEEEVNLFT